MYLVLLSIEWTLNHIIIIAQQLFILGWCTKFNYVDWMETFQCTPTIYARAHLQLKSGFTEIPSSEEGGRSLTKQSTSPLSHPSTFQTFNLSSPLTLQHSRPSFSTKLFLNFSPYISDLTFAFSLTECHRKRSNPRGHVSSFTLFVFCNFCVWRAKLTISTLYTMHMMLWYSL